MYKCAYFGVIDIIIDFLLHAANEKMIKKNIKLYGVFIICNSFGRKFRFKFYSLRNSFLS